MKASLGLMSWVSVPRSASRLESTATPSAWSQNASRSMTGASGVVSPPGPTPPREGACWLLNERQALAEDRAAAAAVAAAAAARNGADAVLVAWPVVGLTALPAHGLSAQAMARLEAVVLGDQVGYAYTEDLSLPAMLEAARMAREIARTSNRPAPEAPGIRATEANAHFYPVERRWSDVDIASRIPLIREAIQTARAA